MITQKDIDKAIDYFCSWEYHYEDKRDACAEFSPAYWHYHDLAVNMRLAACELMPGQHASRRRGSLA